MVEDLFKPNPFIASVEASIEGKIKSLEEEYCLPQGHLKMSLALHLLQFTPEEISHGLEAEEDSLITKGARELAAWLRSKIAGLPTELRELVLEEPRKTKVSKTESRYQEVSGEGEVVADLVFSAVKPEVGLLIQEKLHYIGCVRADTQFHFGLFREGGRYPIAYAAFSKLDRNYLGNALPEEVDRSGVLVLTRLYGVNNAPRNTLSSLIGLCIHHFQHNFGQLGFTAIITTVNPNVFFTGAVFKASNFSPYISVPFQPLYYKGKYLTRRECRRHFGTEDIDALIEEYGVKFSQLKTRPFIGMVRGITSESHAYYTSLKDEGQLFKQVSAREYRQG